MTERDEQVVILCGGRGARLQEATGPIPKPLVEIGGRPILWHVIQIYAAQGFRRFLLLTGHLSESIDRFAGQKEWGQGLTVETLFTGEDTPTGGRLHRARKRLAAAGGPLCVTYADGVADIDLDAELAHHREHGRLATMAVVRPELQFGVTELGEDGSVVGFQEKPRSEHWINGGFFVLDPAALDYVDDRSVLERDPLERLARDGQLQAYRHTGFWRCMDTYKDAVTLNDLWAAGAPWSVEG